MSNIVLDSGTQIVAMDSTGSKGVPSDARGMVDYYEDIKGLPMPYVNMKVIVNKDSLDNSHQKGEYVVTKLTELGDVDETGIIPIKDYIPETDPTVPAHVKAITQQNITDWNNSVPNTRTVNGKALSSNVQLTPSDIGAQPTIDNSHKLSADNIADGSTNKVVTQTEKTTWNGKQDALTQAQLSNIDKGGTALQPSSTAPEDNFAAFDDEGNIKDSGCNESTFIKGVKQNGTSITPEDGVVNITMLSAYEQWLDENGYDASLHDVNEFLESLKAHISKFIYEDYDATAAGDISNIGDAVISNSGAIGNTTPSAGTKDVILLMPNAASSATATMMFATIETSTQGVYEFVYVGSINDLDASTFVAKSQIVNDITTGGSNKVLSAEAGKALNENKLDKIEKEITYNYTSLEVESGYPIQGSLNTVGEEKNPTLNYIHIYKYSVVGGNTYFISGSGLTTTSSAVACFYDSSDNAITSSLVDAGIANAVEERKKVIAPTNAAYLRVMEYNGSETSANCETRTTVETIIRDNKSLLESIGDVSNLQTTEKESVVGAINELKDQLDDTEENVGNKLDKILSTQEWVAQTAISSERGYINSSGVVTGTSYDTKTFSVTPSKQYKIKGRRVGTGSRLACFYVDDGNGGLAMYTGNVQKVGSEGVGEDITTVSNPVPDGDPIVSGGTTSDYHTEVYIAPENTVAIKIMSYNDSFNPIVCEEYSSVEINNQEKLNSIGDIDELDTENKTTLVDAINEVNAKIPDTPTPPPTDSKTIKILLVGSSHGMNTIAQLPWITYKSGLDVEVGNVYIGSFSLQRLVGMNERSEKCNLKYFKEGAWTTYANKSFAEVFAYTGWDYISVQRSASDDMLWITTQNDADEIHNAYTNINYNVPNSTPVYMSHNDALQYVLDLIRNNVTKKECEIIFNTGFADPSEDLMGGTTANTSQTISIITTAKMMKKQFGIDYYPTALAVRNARNTFLRHLGNYTSGSTANGNGQLCYDDQHLDYGIGCYVASMCLLEFILRKHGMSIINLTGYGTQSEVYSFNDLATVENYTQPTEDMMIAAKACAMCANDGFEKYLYYTIVVPAASSYIFTQQHKLEVGDTLTINGIHCIVSSIDTANNAFTIENSYSDDVEIAGTEFSKIITKSGDKPSYNTTGGNPTDTGKIEHITISTITRNYKYGNKDLMDRFKWKITYNLGSGITKSGKEYCGNGDTYKATLDGTINSVGITSKPWDRTQSATTLVEGTDYTYDSSTGELVIGAVQGDITITVS